MHIYPLEEGGEYVFRLEMADGKEYTAKLNFPKPKRVELVLGEEQKSLDTEGIFMRAFSMKGIDMANVEFVYHILSDNAVVAISSNADGKFLVGADILTNSHHVFLVKYEGAWYYTTVINSEE